MTEAAALASARYMGRGDETAADVAAIEAMRKAFDAIAMDGTVVIGEGSEDAMPMLYVGERVGTAQGPATDVALDALEGAHVASPRIEVTAGENLAGTECWVRVSDNGPGISQDALARIFSPFYTRRHGGTGLGLAISKKVVDAHGGSIEAQSTPGAGAEFTITIPKRAVRS